MMKIEEFCGVGKRLVQESKKCLCDKDKTQTNKQLYSQQTH